MTRNIATTTDVDLHGLLEFVRPRHQMVLVTSKRDGSPQISPVSGGVDEEGRIMISTYPERAKTANARRDPQVSVLVLSEEFNDAWVQVSGTCEVIDPLASVEPLVDYIDGHARRLGLEIDPDLPIEELVGVPDPEAARSAR